MPSSEDVGADLLDLLRRSDERIGRRRRRRGECRVDPVARHCASDGLAFGNPVQLLNNVIGAFAALAWAVGITALIIKVMDLVWPGGIRVTPKEEEVGLDLSQHGERAYVTE